MKKYVFLWVFCLAIKQYHKDRTFSFFLYFFWSEGVFKSHRVSDSVLLMLPKHENRPPDSSLAALWPF